MTVAFDGASTLKPRKMTTSQETRMISIGIEIEGTDCAASSDRTWAKICSRRLAGLRP